MGGGGERSGRVRGRGKAIVKDSVCSTDVHAESVGYTHTPLPKLYTTHHIFPHKASSPKATFTHVFCLAGFHSSWPPPAGWTPAAESRRTAQDACGQVTGLLIMLPAAGVPTPWSTHVLYRGDRGGREEKGAAEAPTGTHLCHSREPKDTWKAPTTQKIDQTLTAAGMQVGGGEAVYHTC